MTTPRALILTAAVLAVDFATSVRTRPVRTLTLAAVFAAPLPGAAVAANLIARVWK